MDNGVLELHPLRIGDAIQIPYVSTNEICGDENQNVFDVKMVFANEQNPP